MNMTKEELELHLRLAHAKIRKLEKEVETWKQAFRNKFSEVH